MCVCTAGCSVHPVIHQYRQEIKLQPINHFMNEWFARADNKDGDGGTVADIKGLSQKA